MDEPSIINIAGDTTIESSVEIAENNDKKIQGDGENTRHIDARKRAFPFSTILNDDTMKKQRHVKAVTPYSRSGRLPDPPTYLAIPPEVSPDVPQDAPARIPEAARVPPRLSSALGNGAFFQVHEYNNELRVYIRRWDEDSNRALVKGGISLTLHRFKTLQNNMEGLSSALKSVQKRENEQVLIHLGGMNYAIVKSPHVCVIIRRFYKPELQAEGELLPGSGINLKPDQWERLCEIVSTIDRFLPELKIIELCYNKRDCLSRLCPECFPLKVQAFLK